MSMNARNNDTTRPRKSGAAKTRRFLEHRKRLMGLGVSEDVVKRLSSERIRELLHNPKLIPTSARQPA